MLIEVQGKMVAGFFFGDTVSSKYGNSSRNTTFLLRIDSAFKNQSEAELTFIQRAHQLIQAVQMNK